MSDAATCECECDSIEPSVCSAPNPFAASCQCADSCVDPSDGVTPLWKNGKCEEYRQDGTGVRTWEGDDTDARASPTCPYGTDCTDCGPSSLDYVEPGRCTDRAARDVGVAVKETNDPPLWKADAEVLRGRYVRFDRRKVNELSPVGTEALPPP